MFKTYKEMWRDGWQCLQNYESQAIQLKGY